MSRTSPSEWVDGVAVALLESGRTLATAESCTGGWLGKVITDRPGSSEFYAGGVVAYSNNAKVTLLGVSAGSLETHGAVSEQVAEEMATGVRERLGADVGVSVTGIAGPGGGSAAKPVGTVWIGVATADSVAARRFVFDGDRDAVRADSVAGALESVSGVLGP